MQGINTVVRQAFSEAITAAFPSIEHQPLIAASRFGDFQCNSAPSLFKAKGPEMGFSSPKEAAEAIQQRLPKDTFSKAEASPQGFITIEFSPTWIEKRLQEVVANPVAIQAEKKLRVAVDFSSPNVAKEMHVGHLRSTIIGDSMCRILEFVGHYVERINHIGDWGTQFGMLVRFMEEEHPDSASETPAIGDLQKLYRGAKEKFDCDEGFKTRSREAVVALQKGSETEMRLWRAICNVSQLEFQKVYDRLQVELIDRGESFYNDMLPSVIAELTEKKLVVESDGALCVFTTHGSVPLMAVKSDGGYGYDSTDLAAIRHRLLVLKCNWLIYVTDLGQEDHFLKIFDAARLAGWYDPSEVRCTHAGFGVIQGADGKKFKTRSGCLVRLVDLLDEAVSRAAEELRSRAADEVDGSSDSANFNDFGRQRAAELIGYSAVKYFDLKQNRLTDYKFSFDRMLDPKGNTALYLLYAYARICAIFRKAQVDVSAINPDALKIKDPSERKLGLLLLQCADTIFSVLDDLMTHRLADYVYKVTCCFSEFYTNCKVLDSDNKETQESRLLLCEATRKILETCFQLLGVKPLERL